MHKRIVCYCCDNMVDAVTNGIVTVNSDGTKAFINVVNVPTPDDNNDQNPTLTPVEITFCFYCGDIVVTALQPIPIPTYSRATVLGGSCDDNTCRENDSVNSICKFAFIGSVGCLQTSDAAKQAYTDLRASVQQGWNDMLSE